MIENTGQERVATLILHWTNNGESAHPLMEFVGRCRPDSKRTDIKKWLKFGQLMVDLAL